MSDCCPRNPGPEPGAAPSDLSGAVRRCRQTPPLLAGLWKLYEEVQRRTAQGGSRCLGGGGCCKFDLAGHRLYLTTAELALLIERPPAALLRAEAPMRCPYQVRGRCTAYDRRPLGCRVYFCGPGAAGWYASLYEEYHQKVGALHDLFEAPYRYVELTAGLEEVLGPAPGPPDAEDRSSKKNARKTFASADGSR